jgi:radical SAM protein with 4Fe4S-binding SPASM domain
MEQFAKLKEAFDGTGAYVYLKSQDQLWYNDTQMQTRSIHWLEFCQFPWSSMTIKSNGQAVQCVEDFNNEIILGDVRQQSLGDIWNGAAYRQFRRDHFLLKPGIKCSEQCDMKLIGRFTQELGDPA